MKYSGWMNVSLITTAFPYFTQLETTAESFVHKIVAGHLYKPTSKISAPVKLVKPTENYAKLQGDYGLSEVRILLCHTYGASFIAFRHLIFPPFTRKSPKANFPNTNVFFPLFNSSARKKSR